MRIRFSIGVMVKIRKLEQTGLSKGRHFLKHSILWFEKKLFENGR